MADRKPSKSGQETKSKIIDAALETVALEGVIGASARTIAKVGDFNQALIFYHFGSVPDLLFAAVERAHLRRMDTFGPELAEVADLAALVAIGTKLRGSSSELDSQALPAILAGWPVNSGMGPRIREVLEPWDDLIADALQRVFEHSDFAPMIPYKQMAHSVSALFLGLEMYERLDPGQGLGGETFSALQVLAALAGPLVEGQPD